MKFSGIVKKNLGRGRQLGFPTANIEAPADLEDGIYVGLANNQNCLVFVGKPLTFDDPVRRAEIYFLGGEVDVYDQKLEVETLQKIRDNKRFASEQELVEQMRQDERVAKDFFANYNKNN